MGNTLENTQAQMRKGVLEFCILSILSQEEVYPSDIISRMKQSRLIVVEGTLYPLLSRLRVQGLIDNLFYGNLFLRSLRNMELNIFF